MMDRQGQSGVPGADRARRPTLRLNRSREARRAPAKPEQGSGASNGTPKESNRGDRGPASQRPAPAVSVVPVAGGAGEGAPRSVVFKGDEWRRVRKASGDNPAPFVRDVVRSACRGRERQAKGGTFDLVVRAAPASLGPRLAAVAQAGGHESVSDLVISILDSALADHEGSP